MKNVFYFITMRDLNMKNIEEQNQELEVCNHSESPALHQMYDLSPSPIVVNNKYLEFFFVNIELVSQAVNTL